MSEPARSAGRIWKIATLAGMASYLDAGALVTSGIAIGGSYAGTLGLDAGTVGALLGLQTLMFALGALCGGRLGDLSLPRRGCSMPAWSSWAWPSVRTSRSRWR